jgi:hypothetical protein
MRNIEEMVEELESVGFECTWEDDATLHVASEDKAITVFVRVSLGFEIRNLENDSLFTISGINNTFDFIMGWVK